MKKPAVLAGKPGSSLLSGERRVSLRRRVSLQVPCWLVDGGPVWKAHIRDISTLGIGMNLPQSVTIGSLLEMDLRSFTEVPVRRALARVVHICQEERGWWLVGCVFINELTVNELKLTHAEAVRSKANEQRRWVRFPCNVETVCYTCDTTPRERRPARVLNISAGGVGLLVPCLFAQGTLLHFELPAGPNQPARISLVRVVHVLEHWPGMWFHGCEFADQLAEEDLRTLLR
jgi:hypothetical protein